MNQGIINRSKAELERLKKFLRENEGELSDDELNAALERISYLIELIDLLEGSG